MSGHQTLHVFARTALDDTPLQVIADLHEAVVLEEAHQEPGRHVEDGNGLRRPDGGNHRNEVVLPERIAIPAFPEVITDSERIALPHDLPHCVAVEAHDIRDHAIERRSHQVSTLGEDTVQ